MQQPDAVGSDAPTSGSRRWVTHCVVSAALCLGMAAVSFSRTHYFEVSYDQFGATQNLVVFLMLGAFLANYAVLVIAPDCSSDRGLSTRAVMYAALPMAIILVVSPPMLSLDITAYLLGARNLVHNGLDPYSAPLNAVAGNPWLGEIGKGIPWIGGVMCYGPLFYLLCVPWVLPAAHSVFVAIYLYKGFLLALFVVSIPVFDRLARGLGLSSRATALYALNPALLIHTMLDGHNDYLMAFAAIMALYMAVTARWAQTALWVALATAVKYYSVVLLPLAVFRERRLLLGREIAAMAIVVVVMVASAAPLGFPFREMLGTLQGFGAAGPLYQVVPTIAVFDWAFGPHSDLALRIAAVASYGLIVYLTLCRRDRPVEFAFWSLTTLLLLIVRHFGAWYLVAVIPAGALLAHNSTKYAFILVALTTYSLFHFFGI